MSSIAFLAGVGKVQCASLTAAAEVGMALESEAVASAVREADFERMQREAAEAGIASLQDASEKLKQKLKAAQVNLHQPGLLHACLFGCIACTVCCQLVPTDGPEHKAQQLSALYQNPLVKLCTALLWGGCCCAMVVLLCLP